MSGGGHPPLTPAKAGVQHLLKDWVPAFAGTNGEKNRAPYARMSPPAAPRLRERVGDAAERFAAFEILQRERKLPPPVRMLLDRARNVDLVALAHDVVERNRHEARGRLRE